MLEQKQIKKMVKDYWEHRAFTFDNSPGHVLSSKREERAWKNLLKKKLGDVNRVLDVGAGTGFLSIILAEMGYEVVGVDISKNMIDRAKAKAENKRLKMLKPGGKLCFFVHTPLAGVVNKARKQLSNFLLIVLERRNPWNSPSKGRLPFKGGVEPEKVINLLEKAGFEQISVELTDEIRKLKRENVPFLYKIAPNYSQYCYSALKPNRGFRNQAR